MRTRIRPRILRRCDYVSETHSHDLYGLISQDSEDPEQVPFLLSLPRMPRKFLFYCHPYPCQRTDDVTPLVQLLMYRVMHLIATKILSLSILVIVLPTR